MCVLCVCWCVCHAHITWRRCFLLKFGCACEMYLINYFLPLFLRFVIVAAAFVVVICSCYCCIYMAGYFYCLWGSAVERVISKLYSSAAQMTSQAAQRKYNFNFYTAYPKIRPRACTEQFAEGSSISFWEYIIY